MVARSAAVRADAVDAAVNLTAMASLVDSALPEVEGYGGAGVRRGQCRVFGGESRS